MTIEELEKEFQRLGQEVPLTAAQFERLDNEIEALYEKIKDDPELVDAYYAFMYAFYESIARRAELKLIERGGVP